MISPKQYQNYSFLALFAAIVIIAFFIIRPFILSVVTAFIIGYVFYPVYNVIRKVIKNRTISSLLTSFIIIVIITIPLIFLLNAISNEAYTMYTISKQKIIAGDLLRISSCEEQSNALCGIYNKMAGYASDMQIKYYLSQSLEKITSYLIDTSSSFIFSIPVRLLEIFITFFVLFYYFKDHKRIVEKLKKILPIKSSLKKDIVERIDNVTYAIVFGYILIALLEGVIGSLGFYLFVGPNSSYILWGLVIAMLAFIPIFGAAMIWIPAIIIQFYAFNIIAGFGLIICLFATSYLDNISRPKIIGKKANVHPVIVLLGVLGGLALLGPVGIFLGPLVLALLNTFIKMFESKKL